MSIIESVESAVKLEDASSLEQIISGSIVKPRKFSEFEVEHLTELAQLGDYILENNLFDNYVLLNICKKNLAVLQFIDFIGRILDFLGESKKGIDLRLKVADVLEKEYHPKFAANTIDFTAYAMYESGNLEDALKEKLRAGKIFEKIKKSEQAAYSYAYAAKYSAKLAKYDDAVKYKEISYDLFMIAAEGAKNEADIQRLHMSAKSELAKGAQYAAFAGDLFKAAELLEMTKRPLLAHGFNVSAAQNLEHASDYLNQAGRPDAALKLRQQALEILSSQDNVIAHRIKAKIEYLSRILTKPL
jgi:hypothetical protein